MSEIKVGLGYLPRPIVDHMRRSLRSRAIIPHVYHVTELIYCLRKAYYLRLHPGAEEKNIKSLWNIYRGVTFDHLWSPLFEDNQKTYVLFRENIGISGTFDFIYIDEDDGVPTMFDLKMPASVYYTKIYGVGVAYQKQIQAYLEMAHQKGEYLDVHGGRIMKIAEDLVFQDVEENPIVLDELFDRGKILDYSITTKMSHSLLGPEEKWECGEEYCPADEDFRKECARCKKPV